MLRVAWISAAVRADSAMDDCARRPTLKEAGRPAPGRCRAGRALVGKPMVFQMWVTGHMD